MAVAMFNYFLITILFTPSVFVACIRPDEERYWEIRKCYAQIFGGDITDRWSILPEKYKRIFADETIPRESLVSSKAMFDWVMEDYASRSPQRLIGKDFIKHLDNQVSVDSFKLCLAHGYGKRFYEKTCVKKNQAARVLALNLLSCLDEIFIEHENCWGNIIAPSVSTDTLDLLLCESSSRIVRLLRVAMNERNRRRIRKCLGSRCSRFSAHPWIPCAFDLGYLLDE